MNSAEGKMTLENECHCHTVCHIAFAVTILHIIAKLAAITANHAFFWLGVGYVMYGPPGACSALARLRAQSTGNAVMPGRPAYVTVRRPDVS